MPHVIVKLWPGKSEQQKARLAEAIAKDVMDVLGYGEESVWSRWGRSRRRTGRRRSTSPDIVNKPEQLYKKPGYDLSELP